MSELPHLEKVRWGKVGQLTTASLPHHHPL